MAEAAPRVGSVTWKDRLWAERTGSFVGRVEELALFRRALTLDDASFNLLFVVGPGGIGKTALLTAYALECRKAGVCHIYVDGHTIEPHPDAFLQALRDKLGLAKGDSPISELESRPGRQVLLIDNYHALAPIDAWMRDDFLPLLPDKAIVVIACQRPPSSEWRSDPGWQNLVRVLTLENLSESESMRYLAMKAVPPDQHEAIIRFCHGHPLALSLIVDLFVQNPSFRFQPEEAFDVIQALVRKYVSGIDDPALRSALEACALVRVTTETLLGAMLGADDVRKEFEWLQTLSFIDSGPFGVYPQAMAREALAADLRWRRPERYEELRRRARAYYAAALQSAQGPDQERILHDYLFLHRDQQVVQPFLYGSSNYGAGGVLERAASSDYPSILAMAHRLQGERAARILGYWMANQPEGVFVIRNAEEFVSAFVVIVSLEKAGEKGCENDPGARQVWKYLQSEGRFRPGDAATMVRFWMDGETYQSVSPNQSAIFLMVLKHCLSVSQLKFTFLCCSDPDFWEPLLSKGLFARIPEADFEVDGKREGVFGCDWRRLPPRTWLALLSESRKVAELSAMSSEHSGTERSDRAKFVADIRSAFKDFHNPDALQNNVLLYSGLVGEKVEPDADVSRRIKALQAILAEVVDSMEASPRRQKYARALRHTYLEPKGTQEQVSEFLDLPFSTYRGHLRDGLELVSEILWRRQVG